MSNNGDELLECDFLYEVGGTKKVVAIGNFHKTLPHNKFGEVDPAHYAAFKLVAVTGGDYETVKGSPTGFKLDANKVTVVDPDAKIDPIQSGFKPGVMPLSSDKLNNPQAARFLDGLSGGSAHFMMPPAPKLRSLSTAAEMTELQWMAILRDVKFADWNAPATGAPAPATPTPADAVRELADVFEAAVKANEPGGLRLGVDLPVGADGKLDLRAGTLFRCGLPGEDKGPLVSQFFLHDIAYGAQFIVQKVRPYAKKDFLTNHGDWLRAQNTGLDEWGNGYSGDNDFTKDSMLEEHDAKGNVVPPRRISTMRDIARFVNKDALHQAYFNAALLCLSWGVMFDQGNPYLRYTRQGNFGTFGGPDLLTRVSEVASRALAVVWRQKWEVHRRLRPEAYGGLMQMQKVGLEEPGANGPVYVKRDYRLPDVVFQTEAARLLTDPTSPRVDKNYYLPMAFTAGSPPHPAYGAGHATVAGACVTILKAWLDEKTPLAAHLKDKKPRNPFAASNCVPPQNGEDAGGETILEPGCFVVIGTTNSAGQLVEYRGTDVEVMTVEGELNKIACNVAMGRSMGGVHWRSDNTRSLRLGEQIAAEILRKESLEYIERDGPAKTAPYWSFTSFNGNDVIIFNGRVLVNGADIDPKMQTL